MDLRPPTLIYGSSCISHRTSGPTCTVTTPLSLTRMHWTRPSWALARRCRAAGARTPCSRAWPGRGRQPRSTPGVRSHGPFRNRGTESLSKSSIKWMNGGAKRKCKGTLGTPPGLPTRRARAPRRERRVARPRGLCSPCRGR
jgi:hypothetical protein